MSTTSYSTNDSRPTSRHYDTGFPDSFATCTTSMRHPDAIIDPGFAISAEHIDPAKSLHRSRKSLLRKHRRTISQGKLDEATLNQISSARPFSSLSAADSATQLVDHKSHDAHSGLEQPLKADAESLSRAKDSETTMGLSSGFHYSDDGDHDGGRALRATTPIGRS
ncbi:hypothetical protein F5Y03DRAFT_395997 [Xylaria venustula]|nr:hypothetical protein F5Y03DRAFT_395997 [Xylaria venustula]